MLSWRVDMTSNNPYNMFSMLILLYAVPAITLAFTANTTRLPNVAPYNTFSLTCTATSSVEGVGVVALPKRFLWLRRYGSSELNLDILSSNATIQIQDGDNLNLPTSSSILTVTENIPQDYWYRCRVDLDLTSDMILNRTDIYPITVTGKTHTTSCSFAPWSTKVSILVFSLLAFVPPALVEAEIAPDTLLSTANTSLMYKSHPCQVDNWRKQKTYIIIYAHNVQG